MGPNWVDTGWQPRLEDGEPGSAWASSQVPVWQGQGSAACLALLQASEDCVSAAEGQALTAWTVRGLRTRQKGRGTTSPHSSHWFLRMAGHACHHGESHSSLALPGSPRVMHPPTSPQLKLLQISICSWDIMHGQGAGGRLSSEGRAEVAVRHRQEPNSELEKGHGALGPARPRNEPQLCSLLNV